MSDNIKQPPSIEQSLKFMAWDIKRIADSLSALLKAQGISSSSDKKPSFCRDSRKEYDQIEAPF